MFLQYYRSNFLRFDLHDKSHLQTACITFTGIMVDSIVFPIYYLGHISFLCHSPHFWICPHFSGWQDIFGTIVEMDRMHAKTITVIQNILCNIPVNTLGKPYYCCIYGMSICIYIYISWWAIYKSFYYYNLVLISYSFTRNLIHSFRHYEKTVYWIPIDKAWNRTIAVWFGCQLRTGLQPTHSPQSHD